MGELWRRVRYVENPNDKNHLEKEVLPSKNHNCTGPHVRHFLFGVARRQQRYLKRREGKRGKRTKRKWEEYVYSSQEGTVPRADGLGKEPCLCAEERRKVEENFLAGPFRNAAVRFGWHIDKTSGRCDCHFLVGEHDDDGIVWQYHGFGKGKKNLKLEFERIEEKFISELNKGRPAIRWLKNARQMHKANRRKAGNLTFAQKLARVGWNGSTNTLVDLARRLGYKIIAQGEKSITVSNRNSTKNKSIRYTITTLAQRCQKEKEDPYDIV